MQLSHTVRSRRMIDERGVAVYKCTSIFCVRVCVL